MPDETFQAALPTGNPASGEPVAPTPASQGDVVLEVGGRKYTLSDLQKKIVHQEQHIQTLETERKDDRKALTDATEALKKAVSAKELLNAAAAAPAPTVLGAQPVAAPAAASTAELADAVIQHLDSKAAAKQRVANWEIVTSTLTGVHGATTDQRVREVARENDMTFEEAVVMAKATPKAFLKLFPELTKDGPKGPTTFNTKTNLQSQPVIQKKPSNYMKATKMKDQIAIYTQKLNEMSSR